MSEKIKLPNKVLGGCVFTDKSMTQQNLGNETNINRIMEKYERTKLVTHLNERQGQYGDFSEVYTYQEALNKIEEAKAMFFDLSSSVRKAFQNDPNVFAEEAADPANIQKLIDLGLATERPRETDSKTSDTPDPSKETQKVKSSPKSHKNASDVNSDNET